MDFDEQRNTEIVDRTKVSGDAVAPLVGGRGELLFKNCDFGDGGPWEGGLADHDLGDGGLGDAGLGDGVLGGGATVVAVEAAGEGSVELSLAGGEVLATIDVPATAGPYDYVIVGAAAARVSGVHDLRLRLRGPLRLARVGFSG